MDRRKVPCGRDVWIGFEAVLLYSDKALFDRCDGSSYDVAWTLGRFARPASRRLDAWQREMKQR